LAAVDFSRDNAGAAVSLRPAGAAPIVAAPGAEREVTMPEGRMPRRLAAVAAALLLAACGSNDDEYVERPPEELYDLAYGYMQAEEYTQAARAFDEVDRQHPYSPWATQAQIMSAYAHYLQDEYDDAIIALDRFIELHPGNRSVAYAYYLKALCYYEQIVDVGRDQRNTQLAFDALNDVVNRFPNTDYARDAALKLDLARDHLAGKDMEVGRFYLERQQYLAAINRFRRVVEQYQTTTHVPEALHRLTECYLALGIKDEAQTAAAVLGYNYPGSDWYQDSYALLTSENLQPMEKDGSWLSSVF
jgi:outer membrane protein assembly factor BamD